MASETAVTVAAVRAVRAARPESKGALPERFAELRAHVDLSLQRGDAMGWACPPLGDFDAHEGELRFRLNEEEKPCNAHAHAQALRLMRVFRRAFPEDEVWMTTPHDPAHVSFTVEVELRKEGATAYFTVAPTHDYIFDVRDAFSNWQAWQWHSYTWRDEVRCIGAMPVFVELCETAGGAARGPVKTYDPLRTLTELMEADGK